MEPRGSAFLFAGHTGRHMSLPAGFPNGTAVTREVFDVVDDVAVRHGLPATSRALTEDPATPTGQELLRFAVSVAVHQELRERGVRPTVLLGHSLGSLTALTCAGAFSVADGARILCLRGRVFDHLPTYEQGMTALALSAPAAGKLVAEVDDPRLAIACHNAPDGTVVCGPRESLAVVESRCAELGARYFRLPVPHAFHGPQVATVAGELRQAVQDVQQRPLRTKVYSATDRRFHDDTTDLLTDLVRALTLPVLFLESIRDLRGHGVTVFVECGAGSTLADLAKRCAPDSTTCSALHASRSTKESLDQVARLIMRDAAEGDGDSVSVVVDFVGGELGNRGDALGVE
jgi:[acyl-carrier-protein] S-malonyltransferase